MTESSGLLFDDLLVLDVASFIAAPVAATVLADFGARVIKVEPPGGDPYRRLLTAPGLPEAEVNYFWQVDNRNKRGLGLDLTKPAARDILYRLIAQADVMITNYTFPARARLGLRYEDVAALNPRLIYASMSAYGEAGAERDRSGFDSTAYWARSGLMHLVRPDPEGEPARSVPGMGDHPTGMALFSAILVALYRRQRSGKGGPVSSSLLANGMWANAFYAQAALNGLEVPTRPTRSEMRNALANHYCCKDGRWFLLALVVGEDQQWERLIVTIERPDLAADERFATMEARHANATTLTQVLIEVFAARDWEDWRRRFAEHRITIGPVAKLEDLTGDAQLVDGGALIASPAEDIAGDYLIDSPLHVAGADKRSPARAPEIGEHNDEILSEFGYSAEEIAQLCADGVLIQSP